MNSSKICRWLVTCEGQRHAPGLRPAHPVSGNYQISAMSQCHTWVMWSHRGQGHSYCKQCNTGRPFALPKWASSLKKLGALRNISGTTFIINDVPLFRRFRTKHFISPKRCWQQRRFLFFLKDLRKYADCCWCRGNVSSGCSNTLYC